MQVQVVLFAVAKELAKSETVVVELEETDNVAALKSKMSHQFPQLKDLITRSAISVNHEFATDDCQLTGASEIALIPPVSGG
jgi:molybdopterin converting factor small subunit